VLGSQEDEETTVVASGKDASRQMSGGAERSVHTRVGLVGNPKDTQRRSKTEKMFKSKERNTRNAPTQN